MRSRVWVTRRADDLIMQHLSPRSERGLVGCENDRAPAKVTLVDHMEQHVGRIGTVGEVADQRPDSARSHGDDRKARVALAQCKWSERAPPMRFLTILFGRCCL